MLRGVSHFRRWFVIRVERGPEAAEGCGHGTDIVAAGPDLSTLKNKKTCKKTPKNEIWRQCLLTRLRLDGSEEAKEVIGELTERAIASGMAPHHNLQSYHYELKNNIILELKDMGEDVDSPVEID